MPMKCFTGKDRWDAIKAWQKRQRKKHPEYKTVEYSAFGAYWWHKYQEATVEVHYSID